MSLIPKRAHGLAVVVENGQPLGTISEAEACGVDRFAQVHTVMSDDLLTTTPESSPIEIFDELTPPASRGGAARRERQAARRHDAQACAALYAVSPGWIQRVD
jgi:hypothetical protein